MTTIPVSVNPAAEAPASVAGAPSDAELSARIARGDREAFADFYEAWFDRVLATARRLLDAGDAEALDVVHDVMLKVARRMVALRDQRAVDAWVARTIMTTVLDRRRSASRRRARESAIAIAPDACDGTDAIAGRLIADERLAWLRAELAALPADERMLLRARFEDGHTLAEIGALLGASDDAAHGKIRRLLSRLRRRASEVFGHDA